MVAPRRLKRNSRAKFVSAAVLTLQVSTMKVAPAVVDVSQYR